MRIYLLINAGWPHPSGEKEDVAHETEKETEEKACSRNVRKNGVEDIAVKLLQFDYSMPYLFLNLNMNIL